MNSSAIGQLIQLATLQLLVDMSQKLGNNGGASVTPASQPASSNQKSVGNTVATEIVPSLPVLPTVLPVSSSKEGSEEEDDGMRTPRSMVDGLYSDGDRSEYGVSEEEDDLDDDPWGVLERTQLYNGSSDSSDYKEKRRLVSIPNHPHDKMPNTGVIRICLMGSRQSGKTRLAKHFLGDKAQSLYPYRMGIYELYTYSLNYSAKTANGLKNRQVFIHIYDAQSGQSVDPVKDSIVIYLSPSGRIEASHNQTVGKYRSQLVHTMIDRPHNVTRADPKWFCISVEVDRGVKALIYKIVSEKLGLSVKTRFGDILPYGMTTPPIKKEEKPLPKETPWSRGEKLDAKERHRKLRDDPTASTTKNGMKGTSTRPGPKSEYVPAKKELVLMRRHNPNDDAAWADELGLKRKK